MNQIDQFKHIYLSQSVISTHDDDEDDDDGSLV